MVVTVCVDYPAHVYISERLQVICYLQICCERTL